MIHDFLSLILYDENMQTLPLGEKTLLLKLAGIGDVAMACRALNDVLQDCPKKISFTWIIDKHLVSLASYLLKTPAHITFTFQTIDSSALFGGSFLSKLTQALRIALITFMARPQSIILLHRDKRYRAFTYSAPWAKRVQIASSPLNEVIAYKNALSQIYPLAASNKYTVPARSPSNRIGILVGGGKSAKVDFAEKRWPHWSEFVSKILNEKPEHTVVLLGAKEDVSFSDAIISNLKAGTSRIENYVGKLSLVETADQIRRLDTFLSVDSGLAHVAACLNRNSNQKIIALFGPTNQSIWAPFGENVKVLSKNLECSPCYYDDGNFRPCRFNGEKNKECMKKISVQDVFDAL